MLYFPFMVAVIAWAFFALLSIMALAFLATTVLASTAIGFATAIGLAGLVDLANTRANISKDQAADRRIAWYLAIGPQLRAIVLSLFGVFALPELGFPTASAPIFFFAAACQLFFRHTASLRTNFPQPTAGS